MDTEYVEVADLVDAIFYLAMTEQQIKGLRAVYQTIKSDQSFAQSPNYYATLHEIEHQGIALAGIKKRLVDHIAAGVFPIRFLPHP